MRFAWLRFAWLRFAELRSAPRRSAPQRSAPSSCAPLKSAPLRFATLRLAPLTSDPLRFAPRRSVTSRFAILRSTRTSGFSSRHAFQAVTPCLSNAMCSSSAMRTARKQRPMAPRVRLVPANYCPERRIPKKSIRDLPSAFAPRHCHPVGSGATRSAPGPGCAKTRGRSITIAQVSRSRQFEVPKQIQFRS